MNVSVYIPCYNVERYGAATIQALLAQTRPPDEILVVDDGSTDRTVEIASQFPVRVIRHECNKGAAAARNTGVRHSRFPLVASVDADVVPAADWLETLYPFFADRKVAGAGGRLIEKFRQDPADCWRSLHVTHAVPDQKVEVAMPSLRRLGGFATILRKSAIEEVGGYDERYRRGHQDHDLSRKLLGAGYTLIIEPKALCHHIRRDSIYSVVHMAWSWNFWGLYYQGYYNNIARKVGSNFSVAAKLAWQHWKSGYYLSLLAVDASYPFLHSFLDLRYHFSPARMPAPPPGMEGPYGLGPPR